MAAGYQSNTVGDIGTLLRLIQEDKSDSAIKAPAAETGSPIRQVIQEPVLSPEAPETSRQVSLKPEGQGVNAQGGAVLPSSGDGAGPIGPSSAGPVLPGGGATPGGVVGPVTYTPPTPGPSSGGDGGGGGQSSSGGGGSAPPPIGTSLRPSIQGGAPAIGGSVKGASTTNNDQAKYNLLNSFFGQFFTPSRGRVGQPVVNERLTPTPTPAPTNSSGQRPIENYLKNRFGWLT